MTPKGQQKAFFDNAIEGLSLKGLSNLRSIGTRAFSGIPNLEEIGEIAFRKNKINMIILTNNPNLEGFPEEAFEYNETWQVTVLMNGDNGRVKQLEDPKADPSGTWTLPLEGNWVVER